MKVRGTVRALGTMYTNGLERLEIHVHKTDGDGLPNQDGQRVPVTVVVGSRQYHAGIRSTANNPYIWISPDVVDEHNSRNTLADAFQRAGIVKNQLV